MIFKYAEFRKFLMHIKGNYEVMPLKEWNGGSGIILRHDVDFDIEPAYGLALIEDEFSVRSTFFILTTAHTYNPASSGNRGMLGEMAKMGFEIGLHFNPLIYGKASEQELKEAVDNEARSLSSITGQEVKSISLHNPSVHGMYLQFPGYRNAYDKQIFAPDRYISDSRMRFKHDVYKFIERADKSPVQVLLHPLHYSEEGLSYRDVFCNYLEKEARRLDGEFRANSTYCESMNEGLFDYLLKRGGSGKKGVRK